MSTSEANAVITTPRKIVCVRNEAFITTHATNSEAILGIRDDGVMVASVTAASTVTGRFDSGVISVVIATGSKICIGRDTSGGNAGVFKAAWSLQFTS